MCLGVGVGGEQFLYWGFGQWHFVIGVLSRDLTSGDQTNTENLVK